jgi:hypothetical protein
MQHSLEYTAVLRNDILNNGWCCKMNLLQVNPYKVCHHRQASIPTLTFIYLLSASIALHAMILETSFIKPRLKGRLCSVSFLFLIVLFILSSFYLCGKNS